MGLENREKSNQIFDGSKMNVPGQGIKTVQVFKDILKNKNSLFSPSDLQNEKNQPRPTPPPTKTPRPTPNNTPTQTTTPTLTPTMTKSGKSPGTPLPTRTSTKTPVTSSTPTNTLTPTKTIDSTPIPTRTNTPSNTQTGTVALTPSETLTPTPNATPSYTPSMTQTLTPNGCFCYEVNITQTDLDAAYGNEIQSANNKIVVQYYNCYEELITFTASTSGVYYVCNRRFESIADFNIECLLSYTQLDLVYTNYLNPDYFTSQITTLFNPCSTTAGCQPPTQTTTPTITQTPTYSPTTTITPSFTPSQTITPTLSPSNPETPSVTPSQTITSTPTVTVTEYPCFNFDVTITQTDIDRASGNTEVNGVVSIVYYSCDELVQELEVTIAGVYTICNKYKKTNQIYNQNVYLVYTQDDEAYNTYDNPEKFTSSFVRTSTVCPTLPPPPPPPPCNPLDFEPIVFTNISPIIGKTVTIIMTFTNMYSTIIDWGDGTSDTFSEGVFVQINVSHVFSVNSDIKIYSCDFNLCTSLNLNAYPGSNHFSTTIQNITQLLPNLQSLVLDNQVMYGDIQLFSQLNNIITLRISSNSVQLYGDVAYLPSSLTTISIKNSYISGDINNIQNQSLISLQLLGSSPNNTVTGDFGTFISNQQNIRNIDITGVNTIYGDISNIINNNTIKTLFIDGVNTITGDITNNIPSQIERFTIDGNNTIYGDISAFNNCQNLINIIIYGQNTVSGDIANLNTNCRNIFILGDNTLYGDIQNLTQSNSLTGLRIVGNNTITGSLNSIPNFPSLQTLTFAGNNTVTGPVNVFLSNVLSNFTTLAVIEFETNYPGGFTSSEVDSMLNAFANKSWVPQSSNLTIVGSNGNRTSNSQIAYNYLLTVVFQVVVN